MAHKSHFSTGPHPDPEASLPVDRNPDGKGVGEWVPRDKHRRLAEYLHGTRRAWGKWSKRYLIDPFCGPGRLMVSGETMSRDGGALVAWRELQAAGVPFTGVMVGDLDGTKAEACASRLRLLGASAAAFIGPAEDTVPRMVAAVPSGALCMAYVDPYNLRLLTFDMLRSLSRLNVDLAVHFSTMDLQRNLVIDISEDRGQFDRVAPGWQQAIDCRGLSNTQLRTAFFQYWQRQMLDLGFSASKEMPFVYNDHGAPMYRLVFFARHDLPLRVWGDVARSPNMELF